MLKLNAHVACHMHVVRCLMGSVVRGGGHGGAKTNPSAKGGQRSCNGLPLVIHL